MIISNVEPFQPSFVRFPVNDNTTGYRPAQLPMLLVVPKRFDPAGLPVPNSEVFLTKTDPITNQSYIIEGVRLFIEDVPNQALVVGHQNRDANGKQLRYPDRELYSAELIGEEFVKTKIDLDSADINFFKLSTDDVKTMIVHSEATNGDYFSYRTLSGTTADIIYYQGAEYYDLSLLKVDDMVLLPDNYYNLVYNTQYFRRNVLNQGRVTEYICVDTLVKENADLVFRLNHPGQVISEFRRLTPQPYFDDLPLEQNKTIAFYRPFTTALQDVFDEQDLLEIVNWIYETPAELLPYLSYQLGWDLPFFPKSLDRQRRAVLRKIVSLQQLKGSRQAVVTIFNLFGFDVLLSNLWWSLDGKKLIRPNEKLSLEYVGQEIKEYLKIQFETVVASVSSDTPKLPNQVVYYIYDTNITEKFLGYYSYPLFRPQKEASVEEISLVADGGDLNLYAFKVLKGSPADQTLKTITAEIHDDPTGFADKYINTYGELYHAVDGSIVPVFLYNALNGQSVLGHSTVLIVGEENVQIRITGEGQSAPFKSTFVNQFNTFIPQDYTTLRYERAKNKLYFSFADAIGIDEAVYVFAAYDKAAYDIPVELLNRRSNYFDLELFLSGTSEQVNPVTLNYAIDFLNKVKAFHSLLRTIRQRINLNEDYEVCDLKIGGDVTQRFDTDIGRLQVPPAILPNYPTGTGECFDYSPKNLGYKEADINLRNIKLDRLEAEFTATESLDRIPFSATTERILPNVPEDQNKAIYARYNQDRIFADSRFIVDGTKKLPDPNTNQFIGQPLDRDKAFPGSDIKLDELKSYKQSSSNSDSSLLLKLNSQETSPGKTIIDFDYISDYKYKGRVDDVLSYVQNATIPEEYRSLMCGLRLGNGAYYTYPYVTIPSNPGSNAAAQNSKTNYIQPSGHGYRLSIEYFKTGLEKTYLGQEINQPPMLQYRDLLGKLYRAYPNDHDENTIHYFNNRYDFNFDQTKNLALTRPDIQIVKPTLHLPGCRFPYLNRLQSDYINTAYRARPWDDMYSTYCGPKGSCGSIEPTFLNVKQVHDTEDNTTIVFDDAPCLVLGNGLQPDIPSLDEYDGLSNSDIIHKVYMGDCESNPAVSFEQVCPYDSSVNENGEINIQQPFFEYVYGSVDYANGYPCLSGKINVDIDITYEYAQALNALGLSTSSPGLTSILFLLSSGIHNEDGYRLSCPSYNDKYNNDATLYINQDGDLQVDPDFLRYEAPMVLEERCSIDSIYLDGTIPTLLETVV